MPDCHQQETLFAYVADTCSTEERERFEAHMAECATCADDLKSFTVLQGVMADDDVKAALRHDVEAALQEQPQRWWRVGLQPAWNVALATTLVIVVAGTVGVDVQFGAFSFSMGQGSPATDSGQPAVGPALVPLSGTASGAARPSVQPMVLRGFRAQPPVAESADELLRDIRLLIEESEQRQRQEVASRIRTVAQGLDVEQSGNMRQLQEDLLSLADSLMPTSGR